MRKLLVASQKGGVGKTTTSINVAAATALAGARVLLLDADPLSSISTSLNLAAHPQRESLRAAGVDLPGVLVSNVLPGLDVLSPYEDGGCSDGDLDGLLALLGTPAFQECYGTLIVDTPPFMGANPGQLLATCDEFVIIMRAEPMAYRTLPAFLELVQRSRAGHEIKLRGILLTLPEGEQPGGRWERELRGRLGARILPLVVPFDETAAQASLFGQIVSQANPESAAAEVYRGLTESLELAAGARETIERTSGASALLLASASLKNAAARRGPVRPPAPAPAAPPAAPAAPAPRREPAAAEPMPEVYAPTRRRRTPVHPIPAAPAARARARTPARAAVAAAEPPAPGPAPAVAPAPAAHHPLAMGTLYVAAAAVVGVGLRFLQLPDYMVPVLVGVGVGAVVVVLARFLLTQEEAAAQPGPAQPPRPAGNAPGRLSGLKRRPKAPARDVSEN